MTPIKQRLAILGSTGSIGTQTLDIVRNYPDRFEVTTLTANRQWEKLAEQAVEFLPDNVVIADKRYYTQLCQALADYPIKVYTGSESLEQVVCSTEVDTVVMALVGYSGLFPTAQALRHGKKVALANKECLVVAGEIITRLSAEHHAPILPVDSEHSAIFQCLAGENTPIDKIILTASGGPFLHKSLEEMKQVGVEQALNHPNWHMGAKVTIDSASLMNKGFEVIEARWLFGLRPDQIDVVIHPGSIIHSMVQFQDGHAPADTICPYLPAAAAANGKTARFLHTASSRVFQARHPTVSEPQTGIRMSENGRKCRSHTQCGERSRRSRFFGRKNPFYGDCPHQRRDPQPDSCHTLQNSGRVRTNRSRGSGNGLIAYQFTNKRLILWIQ